MGEVSLLNLTRFWENYPRLVNYHLNDNSRRSSNCGYCESALRIQSSFLEGPFFHAASGTIARVETVAGTS